MNSTSTYISPGDELKTYRSAAIFAVVIVFTITSTISIILRLIAKLGISRVKLQIEDYVILVAQLFLYGMGTSVMLEIFLASAGHHANEIPPTHVASFLKILVAMQVFYGTILALIKTSICLFYIRIFFVKPFRIACWCVIVFIVSWGAMVVLTAFLLCTPLAFNWDQSIPGGHCADQPKAFIAVGVLDLLTDVCVFVLPIPMIWQLQVSKGNKMALFGIFGLGAITMIVSILRIQALLATNFQDITFSASYPLLWSFLEPALGISVACGPTLGPLVKNSHFFQRHTTKRSKTTDSSGHFERLTQPEPAHALSDYPSHIATVTSKPVASQTHSYMDRDSESGSTIPEAKSGIGVKREWETQVSWNK